MYVPLSPSFQRFHSKTCCLGATSYLEKSAVNDLKSYLEPHEGRGTHISSTSAREHQTSIGFATAAFELQAILRQLHRMTPK